MSIENLILEELNLCRSSPSFYCTKLRNSLQKSESAPINGLTSQENLANAENLFEFLLCMEPVNELNWSQALYKAANIHCISLSRLGLHGHIGTDGSDPGVRASRFCKWTGSLYENICYGDIDAEFILAKMLLSEGENGFTQRNNMLKPSLKYIGISVDHHKPNEPVCVIVLAEEISQENTSKAPIKKGPVTEYVKVKEITPQEKLAEKRLNYKNLQGLTPEEVNEIKEFFARVSAGNETLSPNELKSFMDNPEFNESIVISKIRGIEIDKLESLDFESFVGLISKNLISEQTSKIKFSPIFSKNSKISSDHLSEYKEIFDGLDYDRSGFIDVTSLKALLAANENESLSNLPGLLNSLDESENEKLDFGGYLEKMSESEISSSMLSEQSVNFNSLYIEGDRKYFGKNSSFEVHSEIVNKQKQLRMVEKKLTKQVKEVFELLDGDRNGWITAECLKRVIENEEFRKKFQIFCEAYQGVGSNLEKLSYESLCKACLGE